MSFDKTRLPDVADFYASQGLIIGKHGNKGWRKANCLFCQSKDNFNINLLSGGFHCWGCEAKGGDLIAFQMLLHGQDFTQAAKDLGAWVDDGKPAQRTKPMPLSYRDALTAIAHEAQLVILTMAAFFRNNAIPEQDYERMVQAVGRINKLLEAANG